MFPCLVDIAGTFLYLEDGRERQKDGAEEIIVRFKKAVLLRALQMKAILQQFGKLTGEKMLSQYRLVMTAEIAVIKVRYHFFKPPGKAAAGKAAGSDHVPDSRRGGRAQFSLGAF